MAYADTTFYINTYCGEYTAGDGIGKWLERASDVLDLITCGRLMTAFPRVEAHAAKVKKATCAIADALYQVDIHRRAAAPQTAANGSVCGAVSSVTSGKESISYASVNSGNSVYSKAASSAEETLALLYRIAAEYLSNITDANGVNLLYRGVG